MSKAKMPNIPVKSGLVAYYDANSFSGSIWYDYVKKNNATTKGSVINNKQYITGTTQTAMFFPPNLLTQNYTLIHLTRYSGNDNRRRIFNAHGFTWVSGFDRGLVGIAYHNKWITQDKSSFLQNDWVLSIDNLNSYRANRKTLTLNNVDVNKTKVPNQMFINASKKRNSDWSMALVIVYNRVLTASEIVELENWITDVQYAGLVKRTFQDIDYSCATTPGFSYLGKIGKNYDEYEYASYDEKNPIPCSKEKTYLTGKLNNMLCTNWESSPSPVAGELELCDNAFKYFNLYSSENPLITKGNDDKYSNKNTITSSSDLFDLAAYNTSSFPDTNTSGAIKTQISEIISETPLKLGCCMRNKNDNTTKSISVRVPLSPNVAAENTELKSFDFERENLKIPLNTCPTNMYSGSQTCNAFYDVYCKNVSNYFEQQGLPPDKFIKYAPECACYAPTKGTTNYAIPKGIPPKCYLEGCSLDNSNAYIDPISRSGQCNLTVCSSLVDLSGLSAGGNVSVNPVINNNCGTESSSSSDISNTNNKKINTENTNNTTENTNNTTNNTTKKSSQPLTINSEPSSTESSASTDGYIYIVVVIIILLLMGGAGFYFMK